MDISALYGDYINQATKTSKSTTDVQRTLGKDMSAASDDELLEACKQFEAYFYEQVFKGMQEAMVPKSEEVDASNQTLRDYYNDSLIAEYSKSAANQSENGLAQMLYEQMKRNYEL